MILKNFDFYFLKPEGAPWLLQQYFTSRDNIRLFLLLFTYRWQVSDWRNLWRVGKWHCTTVVSKQCLSQTAQWIKYFTVTAITFGLTSGREPLRYTGWWKQVGYDMAQWDGPIWPITAFRWCLCENMKWCFSLLNPPGGLMVTTLKLSAVKQVVGKQMIPDENWHPDTYMAALRDSGFTDVRMEDKPYENITFQAIFATAMKWDAWR